MVTVEDVDRAEFQVRYLKEQYLKEHGWVLSCDTPGAYWLWRKQLRGKDFTGGTDLALMMEINS